MIAKMERPPTWSDFTPPHAARECVEIDGPFNISDDEHHVVQSVGMHFWIYTHLR
jgi:hypothetical protein